jgi:hypothetical protein
MGMKLEREHYGRLLLISASVLMWLLILILFRSMGYWETWHLWKVPTWNVTFMDFRLIPGSAESFVHGFEPTIKNPYDPTHRIFNYPFFWRLFFYSGITEADTVWISISMIVLFFTACFLFPEKLTIAGAVGMLFVLFSPASMLLYERGNVDLFVFFVCAMIVLAESYSAYLATALILFAAIMKLFPILGLTVLLKEPKKKFLWLSVLSVLVLVVYMVVTWDSVKVSWNYTMRGDGLSYGTNVFVDRYAGAITLAFSHWLAPERAKWLLQNGPRFVALGILLFIFVLALLDRSQIGTLTERNLAAFRMGASIYVGTFLLGNNWDYRLAFLVILVPQLVEWMRSPQKNYRLAAWMSLVLVLLSCWHLWIVEIPMEFIFHSVEDSQKFWIILDEIFNWMLFASLAYLLFASTPAWVKELPGFLLSKVGINPRHGQEEKDAVPS